MNAEFEAASALFLPEIKRLEDEARREVQAKKEAEHQFAAERETLANERRELERQLGALKRKAESSRWLIATLGRKLVRDISWRGRNST